MGVIDKHTRYELAEWSFSPAKTKVGFSITPSHEFVARIINRSSGQLLTLYISRDVRVTDAALRMSNGMMQSIRVEDVPYHLRDLAESKALEVSPDVVRAAYSARNR